MKHLARFLPLLVLLLVGPGCDSGDVGPGPLPGAGDVSARVDGVRWTSANATAFINGAGILGVGGMAADGSNIAFATLATAGTHEIGAGSAANAVYALGGATWLANLGMGSGTIVITGFEGDRVTGSFAFTAAAAPQSTATGTRVVTEGEFDVAYTSETTATPASTPLR